MIHENEWPWFLKSAPETSAAWYKVAPKTAACCQYATPQPIVTDDCRSARINHLAACSIWAADQRQAK